MASIDTTNDALLAEQEKFLTAIRSHSGGVTLRDLPASLTSSPLIVDVINALIRSRRLEMSGDPKNPRYNFVDALRASTLRGILTDQETQAVYSKIEEAGDVGIWTKDIRTRTNLMKQRVDKILKKLTASGLIKSVRSITHKNKRLYMLAHIEPNRDITGGPWYTDTDFDSEFVGLVRKLILFILKNHDGKGLQAAKKRKAEVMEAEAYTDAMSAEDIEKVLREDKYQKACKVKLDTSNVLEILQTLYYDGEIEPVVPTNMLGAGGLPRDFVDRTDCKFRTRAKQFGMDKHDLSIAPCGRCNLILECSEHGKVSPYTCKYMVRWLEIGLTSDEREQLESERQSSALEAGHPTVVHDLSW
eukprot:g3990.t1